MADILNSNLYELIGTVPTASVEEIETAYREKALSCDPDKNPNNLKAAQLFCELNKAREILINESSRAAYDKYWNSRQQAMAEHRRQLAELESEKDQFKNKLAARKAASKRRWALIKKSPPMNEQTLKAALKKMRDAEESAKKEFLGKLFGKKRMDKIINSTRVDIKWKAAEDDAKNGGYNYGNLHQMLSRHGNIVTLEISSKKGRALVEYKNKSQAITATQVEKGLFNNPLSLRGLWESDGTFTISNTNGSTKYDSRNLFSSINAQSRVENTLPSFPTASDIS